MMENNKFFLFFFIFSAISNAQEHQYFARTIDLDYSFKITKENKIFEYSGDDKNLKNFFSEFNIFEFRKVFPNSQRNENRKTYLICSDSPNIKDYLIKNLNNVFEFIEYVGVSETELLYYPNDYGITGGANLGIPANLNYLDFVDVPNAWDYTTGNNNIKIGISDGGPINSQDIDFLNKVVVLPSENYSSDVGVFSHGINVSAIAAARGNNSFSSTGVCYDCDIIKSGYGSISHIVDLYEAGSKIINCSWASNAYSISFQNIINEIADNGTIIVASSGNLRGSLPNPYQYPASYDNVISVGAVGSANDLNCLNLLGLSAYNVKNYISGEILFSNTPDCSLPLENQVVLNISKTATLNDKVDILSPGSGHYRHYQSITSNSAMQGSIFDLWTSPSAPIVSGTIGLMLSLNDCLTFNEVESVLKLSSVFIGNIPANQVAEGFYGSGTLNTGDAVAFVSEAMNANGNALIDGQDFWRFNFNLKHVMNKLTISNQIFRDNNTSDFTAKNVIDINENSDFKPNSNGFVDLKVDSTMVLCEASSGRNSNYEKNERNNVIEDLKSNIILYPNPNNGNFRISLNDTSINEATIEIYDIYGKLILSNKSKSQDIDIELPTIANGVYMIKVNTNNNISNLKFIKK